MGMSSLFAFAAIAMLACCGACRAQTLTLVEQGQPKAHVVLSRNAPAQLEEAAQTLVRCIREASGATLPILHDDDPTARQGTRIEIGETALSNARANLPRDFDEDGFVITAQGNAITILGPTPWGTEFGVYDFLERYVGVRWLLPGPVGEDIPSAKTIRVPLGTVRQEPVFFSRLLSGLRGPVQQTWARRNRMHGRVSFHHNLRSLFPWQTYAKSHPEFYPVLNGQRLVPTREEGWQPCFTAPGIVEEAVKNISAFFDRNPEATSYSLGMNDNRNFCQCANCRARISGKENYLGHTDYSDLYYDWCNQVIEGVLKKHPDKWFGCLAYHNVATPPTKGAVHPRLIPFITYDRMKWIDPKLAAQGHAATEAWQKASGSFGWYDYIYGSPYCLPRVYFHHTQAYLRYARDHGVKAHYAEIYPNWGEGPKPYLYLKLWWNPDQDVDKLLTEWYERCVGPEAAPYLAAYYRLWERFWTQDILKSKWFSLGGAWLRFNDPSYLADVKREDIAESRRLLEQCLAKCRTEKQRARARLLEMAFQYYEASALAYLADVELATARATTEAEALTLLERAVEGLQMAQKRRHLALEVFAQDPILEHPLPIDRYPLLQGRDWGARGLWAVADWVLQGDNAVRRRVEVLAAEAKESTVRDQAQLLTAIARGEAAVVSRNPSFEEGEGEASADWSYWLKPDVPPAKPIGRLARTGEVVRTGKYSLLCDGVQRGGPVQSVPYPGPGRYAVVAWIYAPPGQAVKGTAEVSLAVLSPEGRELITYRGQAMPMAGHWTPVTVAADIPTRSGPRGATTLRLVPIVNGLEGGGRFYWDDVHLYRLTR